jgi:hypothetical protein
MAAITISFFDAGNWPSDAGNLRMSAISVLAGSYPTAIAPYLRAKQSEAAFGGLAVASNFAFSAG